MEGFINHYITLSCRLDDGVESKYPQATVYNKDGTLITTKNLSHIGEGHYSDITWTPSSSGYYTVNYTIYDDGGRTINSDYNQTVESVFVTKYPALSSQAQGISSQLFNISGGLPLGQWHGEGAWGASVSTDLSAIQPELDFISSQLFWLSGLNIGISSQLVGLSSQIYNTPPGAGATAQQVWEYAARTLTADSNTINYISSQATFISSQLMSISSQILGISSQIEIYGGGGGGRSYVAYTSKQGPWKYAEKEKIIQDVKDILDALDGLEKSTEKYHKEQIDKLLASEKNIVKSIDSSLGHLQTLKKNLELSGEKDIKLLSSVETSIQTLGNYKVDVEDKFKELESCMGDILSLLGTVTPIERLVDLEEKEVNEK
jgi:hypothetical protein